MSVRDAILSWSRLPDDRAQWGALRVFISFSGKGDTVHADLLATVCDREGIANFYANRHQIGRPIDDILVELQRCNAMVVLVTPAYVQQFASAKWLQYELLGALQRGMYIVPLLLGVKPGDLCDELSHPLLRKLSGISGQVRALSLAAHSSEIHDALRSLVIDKLRELVRDHEDHVMDLSRGDTKRSQAAYAWQSNRKEVRVSVAGGDLVHASNSSAASSSSVAVAADTGAWARTGAATSDGVRVGGRATVLVFLARDASAELRAATTSALGDVRARRVDGAIVEEATRFSRTLVLLVPLRDTSVRLEEEVRTWVTRMKPTAVVYCGPSESVMWPYGVANIDVGDVVVATGVRVVTTTVMAPFGNASGAVDEVIRVHVGDVLDHACDRLQTTFRVWKSVLWCPRAPQPGAPLGGMSWHMIIPAVPGPEDVRVQARDCVEVVRAVQPGGNAVCPLYIVTPVTGAAGGVVRADMKAVRSGEQGAASLVAALCSVVDDTTE